MKYTSRRSILASVSALLVSACQHDQLKFSEISPFTRNQTPRRPIDRVLARPEPRVSDPAQRGVDLAEALTRGDVPGFAAMPTLQHYTAEVMRRLAVPLAELELPLHCEILACRDPGAFAYPSGLILLTHGLFRELESEDTLAFIMGHEIAHLALRHHDAGFIEQARSYSMLGLETYISATAGTGGISSGWIAASYAANIIGRDLIAPSWTRTQEDEADQMSVDLMVKAGYNVSAVNKAMDLLHRAENSFGYKTSTEVTFAEEALMRESDSLRAQAASQKTSNPITVALTGAIDGISSALDTSRRNHRTPAERSALIQTYMDSEYPDAPEPILSTAPYSAVMRDTSVVDTYQRYEAAQRFRREHVKMELRAYNQQIRDLTSGVGSRDGYILHAVAGTRFERGEVDRAIEHYANAARATRPGALPFLRIAGWHAQNQRPRDALIALSRIDSLYGVSGRVLIDQIRYQQMAGQKVEALETLSRCTIKTT
jgi:Zn-dependent protease with chaperone function